MNYLVAAVSFVLGVVAGFGFSTLVSLLMWTAIWMAIGAVACLVIDVLLGLSRKACALRVWVRQWLRLRKRSHLSVVVPFPAR